MDMFEHKSLLEIPWVVADTTSSINSFDVVNNWYLSSAKIYEYYSSMSF